MALDGKTSMGGCFLFFLNGCFLPFYFPVLVMVPFFLYTVDGLHSSDSPGSRNGIRAGKPERGGVTCTQKRGK